LLSLVVAFADIESCSVRRLKLAVLNFFAFFFQLLSNYEVVAQNTFAFVPPALLLSDLKLVEARMWYLNMHLQGHYEQCTLIVIPY